MGMTIDLALDIFKHPTDYFPSEKEDADKFAIENMRKYQKIEDIYYHQSGEALENSLRAVIEDGKID